MGPKFAEKRDEPPLWAPDYYPEVALEESCGGMLSQPGFLRTPFPAKFRTAK
jgi:hypothetical protein